MLKNYKNFDFIQVPFNLWIMRQVEEKYSTSKRKISKYLVDQPLQGFSTTEFISKWLKSNKKYIKNKKYWNFSQTDINSIA